MIKLIEPRYKIIYPKRPNLTVKIIDVLTDQVIDEQLYVYGDRLLSMHICRKYNDDDSHYVDLVLNYCSDVLYYSNDKLKDDAYRRLIASFSKSMQ